MFTQCPQCKYVVLKDFSSIHFHRCSEDRISDPASADVEAFVSASLHYPGMHVDDFYKWNTKCKRCQQVYMTSQFDKHACPCTSIEEVSYCWP